MEVKSCEKEPHRTTNIESTSVEVVDRSAGRAGGEIDKLIGECGEKSATNRYQSISMRPEALDSL